MNKNKLIIAAAGSGKTTFLVNEALRQKGENVLVTTYTQANESEIRKKIIKINKCIPSNIEVQTWFSFLLQHGVKPYQGCLFPNKIRGLVLMNEQSGYWFTNNKGNKIYYSEENYFEKHYFTKGSRLYSDKLSKFVIRCNERSNGNVIERICRGYSHILIDEVQDLAGYDLEIIKLLFKTKATILLVGDPRQVTYLTHQDRLHSGYKNGKIEQFILDKCESLNCEVDSYTLKYSHRNNAKICEFSSKLYPNYPPSEACKCNDCRKEDSNHNGIFLVRPTDLDYYCAMYHPIILRYKEASDLEWNYGNSKGLGFKRILIYPTNAIIEYLRKGDLNKTVKGKTVEAFDIAKFYVALTRATYSVGIFLDYTDAESFIEGVQKFKVV